MLTNTKFVERLSLQIGTVKCEEATAFSSGIPRY
jgi:hypothetical protein